MSMIEPYALFTQEATIHVFPASFDREVERDDEATEIDLKRVVWDVDYRNEVKRRLGTTLRLP
jgi:hypothetical protein